jgi:hypothetical protein
MKVYSFYHKDTGAIAGASFSSTSPVDVTLNTPADHVPIEGAFDYLSQRVDVAAVAAVQASLLTEHPSRVAELRAAFVPVMLGTVFREPAPPVATATTAHVIDYQPPAPSADYEWNADTKRWQLNAATTAKAQARTAALATIATLDTQSIRAMREHALGFPGAQERVAAIDARIAELRKSLSTEPVA